MKTSEWYEVVDSSEPLLQGDFINKCPVIIPPNKLLEGGNLDVKVETYNIIVMSQSCDLVAGKIHNVLVCPYWPLEDVGIYKDRKLRESLRIGGQSGAHLLNKSSIKDLENDFLVVDFKNIYGIGIDLIKEIAKGNGKRLRLMSPYKEHLSQAFARFFMRVGLPSDIPPFAKG